jgi:hypothetical protein
MLSTRTTTFTLGVNQSNDMSTKQERKKEKKKGLKEKYKEYKI